MNTLCPASFTDDLESIPPLPAVVARVLMVTGSPRSSAEDVARALREDPVVAARILRVANSPFYRAARQISELNRAVTRLGTTAVRNLVLGICVRETLSATPHQRAEHETLWRHATAVAAGCELIARRVHFRSAEEAFVAGLLHDVGHLAMLMLHPDRLDSALASGIADSSPLKYERAQFGIDHAEAGARILARWQLPERLCQASQHHRADEAMMANDQDQLPAIVAFADVLAHVAGFGVDRFIGTLARAEMVARQLHLSPADQVEIFSQLERRADEAIEMLGDMHVHSPVSRRSECLHKALWMCDADTTPLGILVTLLEQLGYEVRSIHPSDLDAEIPPHDLILVESALQENGTCPQSAVHLMGQEPSRIAVMKEPDEDSPSRWRDMETGICYIPPLFTIFDITWVQEQLRL